MSLFSGKNERLALMYGIGAQQQGQANALGAIDAGQAPALSSLGQGYDKAREAYGQASDLFAPYAQAGKQGLDAYVGSLGLGGQSEYDSAVNSFHTSPGFTERQNLALDGLARSASATGSLGSGNTLAALTDRSFQLGNAEYGNWQQGVAGLGQMGLAATGSQANLQKGIGDLDASQGVGEAGIYTNAAGMRANAYTNTANSISSLSQNYGEHADDASKNTWSLGMGVLGGLSSLANPASKGISQLSNSWMPKF